MQLCPGELGLPAGQERLALVSLLSLLVTKAGPVLTRPFGQLGLQASQPGVSLQATLADNYKKKRKHQLQISKISVSDESHVADL